MINKDQISMRIFKMNRALWGYELYDTVQKQFLRRSAGYKSHENATEAAKLELEVLSGSGEEVKRKVYPHSAIEFAQRLLGEHKDLMERMRDK